MGVKVSEDIELKVVQFRLEGLLYKDISNRVGLCKKTIGTILSKFKMGYRNKYEKTCLNCEKVFKVNRKQVKIFCSKRCSSIINNKKRKNNKIVLNKKCIRCDELITEKGRRKLCVICINIPKYQTLKECIYSKGTRSGYYSYVRYHSRNKLLKIRKCLCEYCGYDKFSECCHIKAISDFDMNTKIEEINDSENLLFLCPNHHWEFEHFELTIDNIKNSKFYHKNYK